MGVERFHEGDDEPIQKADASRPKDTGSPQDASRSGDTSRSGDVARPEEPTPDDSPDESPETADVEANRAEPRTRSEYADHVAPPNSPPIEGDSPKRRAEEQPHTGNDSTALNEEPRNPNALPAETVQPDNERTEPTDKGAAPHDDGGTDTGLDMGREPDDDLGSEPDDPREPSAVDKLDDLPPDVPSAQETGRGESPEPELTSSSEAKEESPTEGRPTRGDSDQGTLEINERTRPLTDREWAEHLTEVRDDLGWARRHGFQTHRLYTIDPDKREWSGERNRLQGELVSEMYERAQGVPCDQRAIIAGGLGGAGKTTVLTEHANIDLSNYLVVNPDDIKEQMARRGMIPQIGCLSPMEASDLAHEESSYIAKRLAMRAMAEGKNLIWDITMSSEDSTKERINNLRSSGYDHIEGLFVDIPIDTSVRRIDARHREGQDKYRAGLGLGGRFVPEEVVRSQKDSEWGSQNRRTFERVKGSLDAWSIYDNSLDGRSPIRVESNPG